MTMPTDTFSKWFFTIALAFFYLLAVGLQILAWGPEISEKWSVNQQTWTFVAGAFVAAFALMMTEPVIRMHKAERGA